MTQHLSLIPNNNCINREHAAGVQYRNTYKGNAGRGRLYICSFNPRNDVKLGGNIEPSSALEKQYIQVQNNIMLICPSITPIIAMLAFPGLLLLLIASVTSLWHGLSVGRSVGWSVGRTS